MITIGKDNFQVFGSDGLKIVNRRIYIYKSIIYVTNLADLLKSD